MVPGFLAIPTAHATKDSARPCRCAYHTRGSITAAVEHGRGDECVSEPKRRSYRRTIFSAPFASAKRHRRVADKIFFTFNSRRKNWKTDSKPETAPSSKNHETGVPLNSLKRPPPIWNESRHARRRNTRYGYARRRRSLSLRDVIASWPRTRVSVWCVPGWRRTPPWPSTPRGRRTRRRRPRLWTGRAPSSLCSSTPSARGGRAE